MTDEPKALVPPMPEVWDPLKTTCYDDRKKWIDYARQLAEIAQAQAQRADELQASLANRGSVYVTDGHGALWGTAESITWVTDELDRLESTLAQRDREVLGLREALEHMGQCADCAEDSWEDCEGGRRALAALASTTQAADKATILATESREAQP